jgi:hypothetical protein
MKLWSKEALVLGGLSGVLETPLSLFGLENLADIIFILFIICVVMLCFNRVPKFLSHFISHFPKASYYLAAIGWIPYFMIVTTLAFMGSAYYITYSDGFAMRFLLGLAYISLGMVFISLAVAFLKKANK